MNSIKLTEYSRSAGCGCKISPTHLAEILVTKQQKNFNNLLVGYNTNDDAAVLDLGNGSCLVSTTDFFMPIVDDAFTFGKIAAANAISDVYAMGAKPLLALGILGFPVEKLSNQIANEILEGAREICNTANIPLAGGHSIDSLEPFFGMAVTGTVLKPNLKTNAGAKVGNILYLTKPIGSGIFATALKRGILIENDYNLLIENITKLNSIGETLGTLPYVTALTDVTGFGLLGHATEMASAANVTVQLVNATIPLYNGIEKYTEKFIYPDNTTRNYQAYLPSTKGMDGLEFITLCDPQTNGGLLISIENSYQKEFENLMKQHNQTIFEIGVILPKIVDVNVLVSV